MKVSVAKTIVFLGFCLLVIGCQPKNFPENIPTFQVATILSSTIPATVQFFETEETTPIPEPVENEPLLTPTALIPDVQNFPDPESYSWNLFVTGFNRPVGMATIFDESNIFYILEQGGIIKTILESEIVAQPFLDIRDRVGSDGNEQGLLGIALDPNFLENREFYLNYTNKNGNTTISRFSANADYLSADPNSEQILLIVEQPYANHNGGNLAFGPDNFLYIGLGDGGSAGDPQQNAQNMETLLGKMLRIAVSGQEFYAVPSDNPYVDGGGRGEIWASGLRNPWRYSFDRSTGAFFIADVGQGDLEEINYLPFPTEPGQNFGWDFREGSQPFEGTPPAGLSFVDPVTEYDHSQGCSVTGGFVYRGQQLPEWNGVYLYGDYCNGKVWGLLPGTNNIWNTQLLFETGENISSFGEDVSGEVYLISHTGSIFNLQEVEQALTYLPFIHH